MKNQYEEFRKGSSADQVGGILMALAGICCALTWTSDAHSDSAVCRALSALPLSEYFSGMAALAIGAVFSAVLIFGAIRTAQNLASEKAALVAGLVVGISVNGWLWSSYCGF